MELLIIVILKFAKMPCGRPSLYRPSSRTKEAYAEGGIPFALRSIGSHPLKKTRRSMNFHFL